MGGGPLFDPAPGPGPGPAGPGRGGVRGIRGLADTIGEPADPGPGPISTTHGRDLGPGLPGHQQPTAILAMNEYQKSGPILDSVEVDLQSRTLTMHWRGKVTSAYADIRLDGQIACESPPSPQTFNLLLHSSQPSSHVRSPANPAIL